MLTLNDRGDRNLFLRAQILVIAIAPDGSKVIAGSDDCTVTGWDLATAQKLFTLKGHEDSVVSLAVTPEGSKIVSGSKDGMLKIWDLTSAQALLTIKDHGSIDALVVAPNRQQLIFNSSTSALSTLRIRM